MSDRATVRRSALALAALGALLAAAPAATAGQSQNFELGVTGDGYPGLHATQEWTGGDSFRFKRVVDTFFGNKDGTISPDEAARAAAATEKAVSNGTLDSVSINGASVAPRSVKVAFQGLEGGVAQEGAVKIGHDIVLNQPIDDGANYHIRVMALENGTLVARVPGGWVLNGAQGGTATLPLKAGADAGVDIAATGLLASLPGLNAVPLAGLAALVALAAAAGLARRRE